MINIEEIQKILPHKFPFLMIDRVLEVEPGRKVVAIKNVSINEAYFTGHFPAKPVMPGILIVEAMAQASIMLFGRELEKELFWYFSLIKVELLSPVSPGDQLKITVESIKIVSDKGLLSVKAEVEDKEVARGQIGFSIKKE